MLHKICTKIRQLWPTSEAIHNTVLNPFRVQLLNSEALCSRIEQNDEEPNIFLPENAAQDIHIACLH